MLNRAYVFSTAYTSGNILTTGLVPKGGPDKFFRIYCSFDAGEVLSVTLTTGETTVTEKLNGGSALTAGCAYIFDVRVHSTETINFTYGGAATIGRFIVDEFAG